MAFGARLQPVIRLRPSPPPHSYSASSTFRAKGSSIPTTQTLTGGPASYDHHPKKAHAGFAVATVSTAIANSSLSSKLKLRKYLQKKGRAEIEDDEKTIRLSSAFAFFLL